MSTYRTADILFEALMFDTQPSPGAIADFGIDKNPDLYAVYQKLARSGKLTVEQLHTAVADGPKLTRLIGVPVSTVWDDLPPEEE